MVNKLNCLVVVVLLANIHTPASPEPFDFFSSAKKEDYLEMARHCGSQVAFDSKDEILQLLDFYIYRHAKDINRSAGSKYDTMGTHVFGGSALYCSEKFYTSGNGYYLDYNLDKKYVTRAMQQNIDPADGGRAIWLSGAGRDYLIFSSGNYAEIREIGWDD